MKNIVLKSLAAASVLALGVGFAQAQTASAQATNSLQVQVEIVTGCTVNFPNNSGNVNFGQYSEITTNLTETRQVVINCNNGNLPNGAAAGDLNYELSLNSGLHSSTVAGRNLQNSAGASIPYNVYQAANISSSACGGTYWGTASTDVFKGTLTATATNVNGEKSHYFTVCIPAISGQQPAIGTYTDVLTATLSY